MACESFEGVIQAEEGAIGGDPLVPQRFQDGIFEEGDEPLVIGTIFAFVQVPLAVPGTSVFPFYSSVADCANQGRENNTDTSPGDFFQFNRRNVIDVPTGGLCYAKIFINDCFTSNDVALVTINPIGNNIEGIFDFTVTRPAVVTTPPVTDAPTTPGPTTGATTGATTFFDATTFSGDGTDDPFMDETTPPPTTPPETTSPETTPPETTPPDTTPPVTTPPGPTVCNAQTATVRGICIPYQCGLTIQVSVSPSPESDRTETCQVTQRSVNLQSFVFFDNQLTNQLLVDTSDLIFDDYNTPDLGFYADLTTESVAKARCNAGMGLDFESEMLDLTTGPAAVFSCFDV